MKKKSHATQQPLTAAAVYHGCNGGATQSFYHRLEKKGRIGAIAALLMRVLKASMQARVYRGGITHSDGQETSFRDLSNSRKGQCLMGLCNVLMEDDCGLKWGWKRDLTEEVAKHFLFIDLPQGQVKFYFNQRYRGPDYDGEWDGERKNEERIVAFCDSVLQPKSESQTS